MTSKVSLIFADRGAPIELTGEIEIRRAIETGLLSKDTWVTFVDGNKSGKVRAIEAPGVADLFVVRAAQVPEERTTEPSPSPEPDPDAEEPAPPLGQVESAPRTSPDIDQFDAETPGPVTLPYERRGGSGGGGVAIIAVVGVLAVIGLVAVVSNGNNQATSSSSAYPPVSYDQGAPSEIDTRPIERHYAARVLSVRGSASRDGAKVGDAPRGESFDGVLVTNAEGEQWVEIRGGRWDGGFVWLGNLRNDPRPQLTPLPIQLMASYYTEVFKEPSTSSGYLGAPALEAGSRVNAVGYDADGWTEITVEGFGVGYVQSAALERWEDYPEADEGGNDGTADSEACRSSTSANCEPSVVASSSAANTGVSRARPDVSRSREKPTVVTDPSWAFRGPIEFPERAASLNIEAGSVDISCIVQPNGSLTSCQALSEDPPGAGFAQAALAGARRSRVSPQTVNGAAQGAVVRYTLRFRLGE